MKNLYFKYSSGLDVALLAYVNCTAVDCRPICGIYDEGRIQDFSNRRPFDMLSRAGSSDSYIRDRVRGRPVVHCEP